MRISHKYKFIFLANPRTGSTTLRDILDPYSDIRSVHITETTEDFPFYHHISALELKKIFDDKRWNWDEYKKFTVVRNPYDRVVSLWHHYQGMVAKGVRKPITTFEDYVKQINNKNRLPGTLKYFICDQNGNKLIDDILMFENLRENVASYLNKLDLPVSSNSIPHLNESIKRKDYRDYYTDELKKLVTGLYTYEIKQFNYKF